MKLMPSGPSPGTPRADRAPHRAGGEDRPTFSLALRLPIEWQVLDGAPSDALLDRLEHANEGVLDLLFKSVDLGAPPTEDEALAEALRPLQLKIDMLIEMVARLAYQAQPLPAPREVELGLSRLAWSGPEALTPDSWLLAKLYFHDIFREPVTLAGRVASAQRDPLNGGERVEIELANLSDALSESFARLVFLEHRRRRAHGSGRAASARREA
ncbi:MAG: hypothetical protein ACREFD_02105 [Stellaceae bacterium]